MLPPSFSRIRRRWLPASTTLEHNTRLLYIEVFWAAVLSGVTSFDSAFAIRLGASNALIGLLSSAPPLIIAALAIPAARMLERREDRRPYLFWSLFLMRAGYLLVAVLPILAPQHAAVWLVALLIALNIPNAVFTAGWSPMLADILPERRRAFVFSRRSIFSAGMVALVTFIAGLWLNATAFPSNYQTLYALGAAASFMSCLTLERLIIPPPAVDSPAPKPVGRRFQLPAISWGAIKAERQANRSFWNLTVTAFVFNFGIGMSSPLFVLYWVRELNADDGWIGLNNGIKSLAVVVGYFLAEQLIRRKGFKWVFMRLSPLSFLYPFLSALLPDLTFILVLGVMIGLINPGIDLSRINLLLKLAPPRRRPTYMSFYTTVMNLGAVVAPLLSVALAGVVGLRAGLFIAALVRLSGGLLALVFKVEEPAEPVQALPDTVTIPAAVVVAPDDGPPSGDAGRGFTRGRSAGGEREDVDPVV